MKHKEIPARYTKHVFLGYVFLKLWAKYYFLHYRGKVDHAVDITEKERSSREKEL